MRGISPDGAVCCLYCSESFYRTYVFDGQRWTGDVSKPGAPRLKILESKTFQTLREVQLRADPTLVEFWGNEALYVETLQFNLQGKRVRQRLRIGLRSGELVEHLSDGPGYQPAGEGLLYGWTGTRGDAPMQLVTWPDYSVLKEVSVRPDGLPYKPAPAGRVSPQLNMLVHKVDNLVVARRTDDLSVLWAAPVDERALSAFQIVISGDGNRIAFTTPDNLVDGARIVKGLTYVAVLDATDGTEIRRFNVDHRADGLALNHDGSQLAMTETSQVRSGTIEVYMVIRDVATGQVVNRLLHDRVPRGRYQNFEASGGLAFDVDGERLYTSGGRHLVKVWRR